MKTIGLIGGMSWESTASYYALINQGIKRELGGLHSAKLCLYSVDFAEIERLQHLGEWEETAEILVKAAKALEAAGADFFLICTNTMHKVADVVAEAVDIPLLHIADATALTLQEQGINKVGLLGTRFTMEQAFYKDRLIHQHGINVVVPNEQQMQRVHEVIYQELCLGDVRSESRTDYLDVIHQLSQQGAKGVILGCTEIALLVEQQHTQIKLFDTTRIHAEAAVKMALE